MGAILQDERQRSCGHESTGSSYFFTIQMAPPLRCFFILRFRDQIEENITKNNHTRRINTQSPARRFQDKRPALRASTPRR